MNKVLYIILSLLLFSLTVISCAKKDDSSSSISSNSDADETRSNLLTEADEEFNDWLASSTCQSSKIVLYVDKEALSRYQTNNYLLLDPFEGHRQNSHGGEDFEFFRPVFNIADASISVGVITILIFQNKFFKKQEDTKVEKNNLTKI